MNPGRLLGNSLFSSGSSAVVIVVALITTPFFVEKMTAEVYGIYLMLSRLVGYYALVDLGLGQGVTKFVAESVARNDLRRAVQSINVAFVVQALGGIAVSTIVILFSENILTLLKTLTKATHIFSWSGAMPGRTRSRRRSRCRVRPADQVRTTRACSRFPLKRCIWSLT